MTTEEMEVLLGLTRNQEMVAKALKIQVEAIRKLTAVTQSLDDDLSKALERIEKLEKEVMALRIERNTQ